MHTVTKQGHLTDLHTSLDDVNGRGCAMCEPVSGDVARSDITIPTSQIRHVGDTHVAQIAPSEDDDFSQQQTYEPMVGLTCCEENSIVFWLELRRQRYRCRCSDSLRRRLLSG